MDYADPLKRPLQLPAPKILNWTIKPVEIERSKPSPGQILGSHGPPTALTDQTIGPRSEEEDRLPATDGGDFAKRASKTQKEPSSRRFPKPTNPALNPDTTAPDEPQNAMDPKTKKKCLRKFLKRARKLRPKHKPAKADEE
eukprot:XP_011676276.1 PREDICTED: uncharacterized protein LOC105444130 [Strongylocentrotus purpuratus]